jgi:hypothetical protein
MEDEKQVVRDLAKQPYSKQALGDFLDAFNDLSGKDRRALISEVLSNPALRVDLEKWEDLFKKLKDSLEKIHPKIEALARIDYKRALLTLARRIPWETGRGKKKIKDDERKQNLNAAIVAEAIHLKMVVFAISIECARKLRPGVRERLGLPSEGGDDWPSEGTIKSAVSSHVKSAKTNRVNLTKAKTNRVSR